MLLPITTQATERERALRTLHCALLHAAVTAAAALDLGDGRDLERLRPRLLEDLDHELRRLTGLQRRLGARAVRVRDVAAADVEAHTRVVTDSA
ncbi:hypothetical protein ON010_g13440 [Phytophthora cinnamomi]|nr:hypothetical protein ON010_g13440 [Phytophthora cinnamomi]